MVSSLRSNARKMAPLIQKQELVQETARVITSKPVQRAVINSFLLVAGAITLLGTAAIATAVFFQNYVPDQIVTRPIHLQYG